MILNDADEMITIALLMIAAIKMATTASLKMLIMNSDKGVEKTRHNLQESKLDLNLVSLLTDHYPVLLQTVPNL